MLHHAAISGARGWAAQCCPYYMRHTGAAYHGHAGVGHAIDAMRQRRDGAGRLACVRCRIDSDASCGTMRAMDNTHIPQHALSIAMRALGWASAAAGAACTAGRLIAVAISDPALAASCDARLCAITAAAGAISWVAWHAAALGLDAVVHTAHLADELHARQPQTITPRSAGHQH